MEEEEKIYKGSVWEREGEGERENIIQNNFFKPTDATLIDPTLFAGAIE